MDDLHQIFLSLHHLIYIFVRTGMLVQQPLCVLVPGLSLHGLNQRFGRQRLPGLGSAHLPTGSMRSRVIRRRLTQPLHNIGTSSHTAGDNAVHSSARLYRALASNPDGLSAMKLALCEIMMAVYSAYFMAMPDIVEQIMQCSIHHNFTIFPSVLLRPEHVRHIGLKPLRALQKVSQVWVLQRLLLLACQLYMFGSKLVPHASRAGVKDHPHPVVLVKTDLEEMIPRSKT